MGKNSAKKEALRAKAAKLAPPIQTECGFDITDPVFKIIEFDIEQDRVILQYYKDEASLSANKRPYTTKVVDISDVAEYETALDALYTAAEAAVETLCCKK